MLLGKSPCPHPPLRRTASMAGIIPIATADVDLTDDSATNPIPNEGHGPEFANLGKLLKRNINYGVGRGAPSCGLPGCGFKNDASTAHFLETCGLCKQRLFPGRDIYMYSLECREQLIKQEERKTWRHSPNTCSPKPDGIDRMDG